MHGRRGGSWRRKIIAIEFAGAIGCMVLGLWTLIHGHGRMVLVGAWLVSIGLNYVPLVVYARGFHDPAALRAELTGIDFAVEARRAGLFQFWLLVPLVVDVAALRDWRAGRCRE
jgi:hypothetical protein